MTLPLNEMSAKILRRTLWSLPPVLFCNYFLRKALYGSGNVPEMAAWLLFAAAMLILVAIQLAFPIAGMIGDWVSRFSMPGGIEIPPVSYILADRYERERRWEQSMAEFQKIIDYHPEELSAHLGRVRVASRGFDDGKLARKLLRRSLRKLRDAESQRALRMKWERLMKEKVKRS